VANACARSSAVVSRRSTPSGPSPSTSGSRSQAVAWSLYRDYLLPFEIASLFLLVAMIGAVVLGRKD